MADGHIELSDAINEIRVQLSKAREERPVDGDIVFAVGRVQIEVSVEVARTSGGSGGIKFWVVNSDVKLEAKRGATHKVTVELVARQRDGGDFEVAGSTSAIPTD